MTDIKTYKENKIKENEKFKEKTESQKRVDLRALGKEIEGDNIFLQREDEKTKAESEALYEEYRKNKAKYAHLLGE